jgi:hypothetical protein
MAKQPRFWKQLERHALSAEYKDLNGREWEQFLEGVREHGVVNKGRVVLHEGKVLDGWQLYRACLETDTKPAFEQLKLPWGMSVEQWVGIANDHRRHETQEVLMRRAEERRARIAESRQEGMSTRAIAKEEGVSEAQVRRDLEKASTAPGGAVEPKGGRVTGLDGKDRPATNGRRPTAPGGAVETPKIQGKQGKAVFDDKIIEDLLGRLARTLNDRAKAVGESAKYVEVRAAWEKLNAAWKRWQIEKEK